MRLIPAGANPVLTKLPGGVSSDIWHVQRPEGPICVKRALPRLKVDAVWEVPTERNDFEWAWMKEVAQVEPLSIPPLIAQDSEAGCFAMGFLDSAVYPLWKEQLRRGSASVTYSWQGRIRGSLILAWNDEKRGSDVPTYYPGAELRVDFLDGSFFRAFGGAQPGGRICSGGVCRDVPLFVGGLGELVLRL